MKDHDNAETVEFTTDLMVQRKRRIKWRNRIRIGMRLIAIFFIVSFVFLIYSWGTYFYYEKSGKNFQFERAVVTLTELNGHKIDKELGLVRLSPMLKQSVSTKVYRQIGERRRIVGELHAEQSLFGELKYTVKGVSQYLDNSGLDLWMPMTVIYGGGDTDRKREKEDKLEQLSHIEDGFVAEMSFTLNKAVPPQQLAELLADYDLWITGMAMYSGELQEVKVSNYSSAGDSISAPHLTLRPFFSYSEDGLGRAESLSITSDDIDLAVEQMLKDLEWLTAHITYNGVLEDQQRLAFIKKHGVQVYGAVVTGPVRELEKLKDVPELSNFGLGQIEVWDWN